MSKDDHLVAAHLAGVAAGGIRDMELEICLGEVTILLGPCGDTLKLILRLLTGARKPEQGTVRVLGQSPDSPPARAQTAAVLQDDPHPSAASVADLIHGRAQAQPVRESLRWLGLNELQDGGLAALSGDEQMLRLRLALAFAGRPRLLILEEPLAGLDAPFRAELWARLRDEADSGMAVLIASGRLELITPHADRVVFLDAGRIVAALHVSGLTVAEVRSAFRRRSGLDQSELDRIGGKIIPLGASSAKGNL